LREVRKPVFGVDQPGGTMQGLATIPEGQWELFLGVYCTLKGFRPSSPIPRRGENVML
jgi:hypothetical protein